MKMQIIEDGDNLRLEGPGKERGRIAYASERNGKLVLTLQADHPEPPAASVAGTFDYAKGCSVVFAKEAESASKQGSLRHDS